MAGGIIKPEQTTSSVWPSLNAYFEASMKYGPDSHEFKALFPPVRTTRWQKIKAPFREAKRRLKAAFGILRKGGRSGYFDY